MENFCKQVIKIKHLVLTPRLLAVSFLPVRKSDWGCGEMLVVYYSTTATSFSVIPRSFQRPRRFRTEWSVLHDV